MSYSWSESPSGVYKSHELSSDLRVAAIAQTRFMQWVDTVPGYGKKKGDTVTLTRVANMSQPSSDALSEEELIPESTFSLSTEAVTVAEHGRAVPYTSLVDDLSKYDINNAIQKKLRDMLALSLDSGAATAFKAGQVKCIPAGLSTATFDTDGTASTTAQVNIAYYHVEQIRDYMFSTLHIEPYMDGDYMVAAATKACRGIKSDPKFDDWNKYTNREAKMKGEIGKIEGCRFVEINNTSALSGSQGNGSVLGECVFFGDAPVYMAVVQDPELRAKESGDYGRSKGVAWYGIYAFKQVWSDSATAGEAKVVHVTSA